MAHLEISGLPLPCLILPMVQIPPENEWLTLANPPKHSPSTSEDAEVKPQKCRMDEAGFQPFDPLKFILKNAGPS